MSLVNEALRKAAQQAANRQSDPAAPGLSLDHPPIPARPHTGGVLTYIALGGCGIAAVCLVVMVIVLTRTLAGPQTVKAEAPRAEPNPPAVIAPAPPAQTSVEPTPTPEPEPKPEPRTLLDVRPAPGAAAVETIEAPSAEATPAKPQPAVDVPPAPAPTPEPAPAPAPAPEQPAKLLLVPDGEYLQTLDVADAPKLTLGAVIFSETMQTALINGRVLQVGDRIEGISVAAIRPRLVTLRTPEGVVFHLRLP